MSPIMVIIIFLNPRGLITVAGEPKGKYIAVKGTKAYRILPFFCFVYLKRIGNQKKEASLK